MTYLTIFILPPLQFCPLHRYIVIPSSSTSTHPIAGYVRDISFLISSSCYRVRVSRFFFHIFTYLNSSPNPHRPLISRYQPQQLLPGQKYRSYPIKLRAAVRFNKNLSRKTKLPSDRKKTKMFFFFFFL